MRCKLLDWLISLPPWLFNPFVLRWAVKHFNECEPCRKRILAERLAWLEDQITKTRSLQ